MQPALIVINCTEISSNQDWTTDPALIEISLKPSFLALAERCVAFLQETGGEKVTLTNVFSARLFDLADYHNYDEDHPIERTTHKNRGYVGMTPEYALDAAKAVIHANGLVSAQFELTHVDNHLCCDVGSLESIKAANEAQLQSA